MNRSKIRTITAAFVAAAAITVASATAATALSPAPSGPSGSTTGTYNSGSPSTYNSSTYNDGTASTYESGSSSPSLNNHYRPRAGSSYSEWDCMDMYKAAMHAEDEYLNAKARGDEFLMAFWKTRMDQHNKDLNDNCTVYQ